MKLEFKTDLKSQDMYRFNMYHTYTSAGGFLTFAISIAIFVLLYLKWDEVEPTTKVLYIIIALFILFYNPVRFYFKSKTLIKTTILGKTLNYKVDSEGIKVTVPDMEDDDDNKLLYEQIYAVRQSKHNLLIYSSRVNAFVIPLEELEGKYDKLSDILRANVDSHKLCKQIRNA